MIKNLLRKILFLRYPISLSSNEEDPNLIKEFKEKAESVEINQKPESEADRKWIDNLHELKERILYDNPSEFLSWEVVKRTMFISDSFFILKEYRYLKSLDVYSKKWKPCLKETAVGRPDCYCILGGSSSNLVHHAYHLAVYENALEEIPNEKKVIFEFGGGYGSMCRLFHNLGFQGQYIILDLPLFSLLQNYYLRSLKIKILNRDEFQRGESGVLCLSDFTEVEGLEISNDSLFLATWSLSEVSLGLREALSGFMQKFGSFLFAYQPQFGEVDNEEYFKLLKKSNSNYQWKSIDIKHLQSKYLFGTRKD